MHDMERVKTSDPSDTTALLAELRRYGVGYLIGETAARADRESRFPPVTFITALARSPDPRMRDAFISLLLLHPELASAALSTIETAQLESDEQTAERLISLALATLYLQRVWHASLSLVGIHTRTAPPPFAAYWRER
jgi:hypothetical protein